VNRIDDKHNISYFSSAGRVKSCLSVCVCMLTTLAQTVIAIHRDS